MALRNIVKQGDECLQKVCRPVTEFNSRLHTLLDDMTETLVDSGGVGLAAPQVGVLRRVCVVMNEEEEIIELVNPEIVATEGEQTGLEGCLSVPGRFGIVTRPYVVRVRAQDRNGNFFEVEDEELTARCLWSAPRRCSATKNWRTTSARWKKWKRTKTDANSLYGYAGVCRCVFEAAGGGRTRGVRRFYPAG